MQTFLKHVKLFIFKFMISTSYQENGCILMNQCNFQNTHFLLKFILVLSEKIVKNECMHQIFFEESSALRET